MTMRVLVSAATRHGATGEIAEAIRGTLVREGFDVDVIEPSRVTGLDGWDAVILGSAIYMGRWLEPARELVERNRAQLLLRPTWLFSSGPIGNPPKPAEEPPEVVAITESIRALGYRLFPGRLEKAELGFSEKAIIAALRVREGDFRPWRDIEAWAMEIAAELKR